MYHIYYITMTSEHVKKCSTANNKFTPISLSLFVNINRYLYTANNRAEKSIALNSRTTLNIHPKA